MSGKSKFKSPKRGTRVSIRMKYKEKSLDEKGDEASSPNLFLQIASWVQMREQPRIYRAMRDSVVRCLCLSYIEQIAYRQGFRGWVAQLVASLLRRLSSLVRDLVNAIFVDTT